MTKKRKALVVTVGCVGGLLVALLFARISGLIAYDPINASNASRITVGMKYSEAVEILGNPTLRCLASERSPNPSIPDPDGAIEIAGWLGQHHSVFVKLDSSEIVCHTDSNEYCEPTVWDRFWNNLSCWVYARVVLRLW